MRTVRHRQSTYASSGLEHGVVGEAGDGPDGGPVEVEGEVVVDHEVQVREEGGHGRNGAHDEARPVRAQMGSGSAVVAGAGALPEQDGHEDHVDGDIDRVVVVRSVERELQ